MNDQCNRIHRGIAAACLGITLVLSSAILAPSISASEDDSSAEEVFATRIMPIFNSPDPSSCVQCHLASVDLKDYILPSHEETFLALRDQGLINTENPEASKILDLIGMGEQDSDPGARRIHARTREKEYEAFRQWIIACSTDDALVNREAANDIAHAGPDVSDEVVRHSRKDRVLDSFIRNVWSQRMRCFPCHTPGELDKTNPQHENAITRYDDFVREYGGKMAIFQETPEQTLKSLLASARSTRRSGLPLINLEDPQQSLLLLKPMAKLPARNDDGTFAKPSYDLPVSHMGGIKLHENDHSYKSFLAWMEDLAILEGGGYESAEELPADNWLPTQFVIRLSNTPESWEPRSIVQLFVYSINADTNEPEEEPIGFVQGVVTPRRFVNGPLILFANKSGGDSTEPIDLVVPPGPYVLRAHPDLEGVLTDDPTALLLDSQVDSELRFNTRWQVGFKNATMLDGNRLELGEQQ